jgi:hypothetical protein
METKTTTPKYKKQGIAKTENYNKSYYEMNKQKWKDYNIKQNSNYFDCEVCKCSVQFSHRNTHFNTKKHQKNAMSNTELTKTNEDKTI